MKFFLLISLIANGVLGYLLLKQKQAPVMERLIIETHGKPRREVLHDTRAHVPTAPMVSKVNPAQPEKTNDQDEMTLAQVAGEKMEQERLDFLTNELRIPQDTLDQHESLRMEYLYVTGKVWTEHPSGDLPISAKRELLDMEELYYQELQKLYGKKNWERFQQFRDNYNKRGAKQGPNENQPFIFMGI